MADHDGGLIALLAGDHERAAELLGRALAGDPPVQRADARLRRAEALARLGRADEADAEIRAATLEPVRAAAPPGRARGPDDVRAGAERPRARRPRARRAAAARGRGPLAPARRRGRRRRASTSPRWSTSGARRSPASSTPRASSSAWPRSCEDWRPLPTFDDSATSDRAGRGGVEAALRPGALPRVVGGRRDASSRRGDGEGITLYPDGYPDFPMPQELRTAADGRGLTISCLVSYLVFEWRLEPLDPTARAIARARRDPRGGGAPAGDPARRGERVPALTRRAGHRYGLTSSTRLNGVSADRRTRLKPPSCSTSASRCSPAWAPSASPTSWLSDAGVQSIVEPA